MMQVTKCAWCGRVLISGYTMLVRPALYSGLPETSVATHRNMSLVTRQYDVCGECMRKLLEAQVDEDSSGV